MEMTSGEAKVSRRLRKLQEGQSYPGDCGSSMDEKPDWLDLEKFHRGRHVFLRFPYSVSMGTGIGIYWMSQISTLLTPVLIFGNNSLEKARRRLRGTTHHMYQWYKGNAWDPNDEAHRSIKNVRQLHLNVVKRMNARTSEAQLHLTQYDMALTQFSILCGNILCTDHIGLPCPDEDLMCFVHFWAGIGYLLGVEDRFNLCLYFETLSDGRKFLWEIVEQVVKPSLCRPQEQFDQMLVMAADAYRLETDFMGDHGSLMHFTFDPLGIPVPETVVTRYTPICRLARWAIIRYINTPVFGHVINAYTLGIYDKLSTLHRRVNTVDGQNGIRRSLISTCQWVIALCRKYMTE